MTDDEFRTDLLASASARAEAHQTSLREGFVSEVLERLRDAGEIPDAEPCSETHTGQRGAKIEIDAFAFDEADDSLHLFVMVSGLGNDTPAPITLTEARSDGFARLTRIFEQSRDGWLATNIEESRPLSALARRIQTSPRPSALRLNILTDRPTSERLREIVPETTKEGVQVTFQIWDITRLKRIHEATNARDDLVVDLAGLPGGGLTVLPAAIGKGDYDSYLAVVPGEALAEIYIRHGSRLLEGNVRTFLGRRGNINKRIGSTLANEPGRFFAYNNGIAATASAVQKIDGPGGAHLIVSISDLQIVNGAQTTASLAALHREGKLPKGAVFVPMKLSVVAPAVAEELIPKISLYANSQNVVRASDFFANHPFHQRMEGISRRILAPAVAGSLTQTHWYYERARGQHLNDQAGMSITRKEQFLRQNPKHQVITKTDMAKVESCFDLLPDIACRGAEKAFVAFAERVSEDWKDASKRESYGDDWYRGAVTRTILFRTTEALVSKAPWYEGGYRSQIVAYTLARLSKLARDRSKGGHLDYLKIWSAQSAGDVLERTLLGIAEVMAGIIRTPAKAGQNLSEWAKQPACRLAALDAAVSAPVEFDALVIEKSTLNESAKDIRDGHIFIGGILGLSGVLKAGTAYWMSIRAFAEAKKIISYDEKIALSVACSMPSKLPSERQVQRLIALNRRCEQAGFAYAAPSGI